MPQASTCPVLVSASVWVAPALITRTTVPGGSMTGTGTSLLTGGTQSGTGTTVINGTAQLFNSFGQGYTLDGGRTLQLGDGTDTVSDLIGNANGSNSFRAVA